MNEYRLLSSAETLRFSKEARLCFEQSEHAHEHHVSPEKLHENIQALTEAIRSLPRTEQAKLYAMLMNGLEEQAVPRVQEGRRQARATRETVSQVDPEFSPAIPEDPASLSAVFYGRNLASRHAVQAARSNGRSVPRNASRSGLPPGYRWKTPEDIVRHEMEDLDRDQDLVAMPEDRARRRWDQAGNVYKNFYEVMGEHSRQREAMKTRSGSLQAFEAHIARERRQGFPVVQTGPYSMYIDKFHAKRSNGRNANTGSSGRQYQDLIDRHIARLGGQKYIREQKQLRNMYTKRLESNLPKMRAEYAQLGGRYASHPQFGPSFRRFDEIIERGHSDKYALFTSFRHQVEAMRAGDQAETLLQKNRDENFKEGALYTENLEVSRRFAADKYSAIQIRRWETDGAGGGRWSTKVLTYRPNVIERFSDAGSPDLLFDWKVDFKHKYYRLSSSRTGEEGKQILKSLDISFATPGKYLVGSKVVEVRSRFPYDDSQLSPSAADSIPPRQTDPSSPSPSGENPAPARPSEGKKSPAPTPPIEDIPNADPGTPSKPNRPGPNDIRV